MRRDHRRPVGQTVDRWQREVCRHHEAAASLDRRPEGLQLDAAQPVQRGVDDGQRVVRVHGAVPATREVLRRRRDALALMAADERCGKTGGECGIVAERTHADRRIVAVGEHVAVGREVDRDPERGQLAPDRATDGLRQLFGTGGGEREVAGELGPITDRVQLSAFLVDRDDRRGQASPGCNAVELIGQVPQLARGAHVQRPIERHAGRARGHCVENGVGRALPLERGQDRRAGDCR